MNEFKIRKGLIVQGSGSIILDIQGSQGELFSVTDSLSGSLFSVNDISGIPIMEVFSDNTIKMGTFNQEAIIVSGSRTGMGTALPQAKLHISGANNDTLFRIQSPASASIMFVSGSGNVGIGTLTPTNTLNVNGTTFLQGGQTTVRGSGATSATTALRVENSAATARLTILDDGTSAFNTSHLYVSSSGRVAVGTLTPQRLFDVYNGSTSGIVASFGAQISNNNFSGISFGYVEQANASFRKSALVFERTETQGGGTNASGKIHFLLNNNSGTSATALTDAVLTIDSVGTTVGSSRVGIGTRFPTASLHISGTVVTDNLMRVQSTTGAEYFFISASGNVGIGITSPTARLHVSGASNAGLFKIDSPAVNNIIYVSGSGNVGIGTNLPTAELHISGASADSLLRVGSPTLATTLFVTGSGRVGVGTSTPSQLFEVVRSSNTKIVAGDNVGIQTSTASEWIHLSSDPSNNKYLRIDATQFSTSPVEQAGTPDTAIGASANTNKYLTEPDYWMEIVLGAAGGIVLVPCYVKG